MRSLLAALFLAISVPAQPGLVTNLGGGCLGTNLAPVTNDNLTLSVTPIGPIPGIMWRVFVVPIAAPPPNPTTGSPVAMHWVTLSLAPTFVALPSCGCTLHVNPDLIALFPSSSVWWSADYFWTLHGALLYAQSLYTPLLPLGSGSGPLPFGCTEEPNLHPILGNAYTIVL